MSLSDTDTVLDYENSPLSPCLWTHRPTASATENRRHMPSNSSGTTTQDESSQVDCGQNSPRNEFQLSPASQLNVLAQISELADQQSPQPDVKPRPTRHSQRSSVWSAAMNKAKRNKTSQSIAIDKPKAMRQKQTRRQLSQADRLTADMLDWETCSEEDLFVPDTVEGKDFWVYEDISDSDFEA